MRDPAIHFLGGYFAVLAGVRPKMAHRPSTLPQSSRILILMTLTTLLALEDPHIAMPQSAGQSENKPQPPPVTVGDQESDILLLMKEETESVSRGLGKEQRISEAPSNVYVITDEDIRHSGATDLPTVLRRIPGLEVIQMSGADFDVSVRGNNQLPANKLLVMIDGRSIYEDAYGSVFWTTLPITLPEIKRIEVLKGPASAVYGFNAFDGVINIITKSPEEMKGTTLQVGAGELGTIRTAAIQAGTYDKLGYRLSVGHDQNQQWRDRSALALRQSKVNLQTTYDLPASSKLTVQGGFLGNNRFDGQIYETLTETTDKINTSYAYVSYDRPNFFIRGWWNQWTHNAAETVIPSLARFFQITDPTGNINQGRERNTYNVDAQHTLELATTNRFTYGINYRFNHFESNYVLGNTRDENRLGLYIQDEWRPIQQFTVLAGVRYDVHSQINPTISPRITILYMPTADHTFRVTGAVAYRPPTLYESSIDSRGRIFPLGCPPTCQVSVGTSLVGNNGLQPEQMISYDAGYQGWYFKHRLRARLDLFYNQVSELIAFNAPSPTNLGKADIYGGEAGFEFLATKWLTGFANVSYVDIGQSVTGTVKRGAPTWKANGGLRAEFNNGLNGEAAFHYVGAATYPISGFFLAAQNFPGGQRAPDQTVGSYILVNVRVGYQFWHDKAEIALSGFNALNDKHQEHPLGDVIGSRVMGWLTIKY